MSNTTKNDLIRVENPLASLISKEELLEACPNLYEFLSGILSRSEGVYDIIFSDGGSKDTNNILVAIKGHNGVFMSGFTVAKGTFKLIPADNSHLLPLDILGNGLYVGLASIVLNLSKGYISEDSAMAYVDGQIISGELPQELEDGFRGMVGIARYTDGSDKILLNVKITDKAILIDITK